MATFTGSSSSETLNGSTGNDILNGGAGNDTIFGGAGDDTIYGGADGAVTANYVSVNGSSQTISGTSGRANFTATTVSADGDLTAYNFYGVNGVWIGNGDSTEGHTHTMSTAVAGARVPFNAVNTSDVFSISLDGVSVNLNTAIANGTVTFDGAGAYGINATGGVIGLANGNALATGTLTINVPFTKIGFSNTGSGNGTVYDLQVNTNPLSGIAAGGDDALYGGDGNDVIYTETGNDTVDGGNGNDTVDGGTGRDSVSGGAGDDSLLGGTDNDTLSGDAGKDQLFGGSGADALYGGADDDRLDGGTEADTLFGGSGNDQLIGGSGADSLFGGDDSDNLYGGSENDDLAGDAGNDLLDGGVGNDTLDGGVGNDSLSGGAGADRLTGGDGIDTADYSSSGAALNVTLGGAALGGDAQGDVLISIENLIGSAYADTLAGDIGANVLQGGAGSDSLSGGAGDDRLYGGADSDTLVGGAGADVLAGGDGIDTADYSSSGAAVSVTLGGAALGGDAQGDVLSGIENLTGSAFADILSGDANANLLTGGAGNDSLSGGAGNDSLHGGTGNDTLAGGSGADNLIGGEGTDTANYATSGAGISVNLSSGTGLGGDAEGDKLSSVEGVIGSAYSDTLTGSDNADIFVAGAGNDVGYGGGGADSLIGGEGDDTFYGGSDADQLTGGSGADFLVGDEGADTLEGGDGDDTLHGGQGNDQSFGGAGNDLLYSSQGDDLLDGGKGNDSFLVSDGSGYQKIIGGDEGGDNDTLAFSSKSQGVNVTFDGDQGGFYRQGNLSEDDKSAKILSEKMQFAESDAFAVEAKAELVVDTKTDQMALGEGSSGAFSQIERVVGTHFDDKVDASSTKEGVTAEGGAGQDTLIGGYGSDQLFGGDGNDQLFGGDSQDYLTGGTGDDWLKGGAGADKLEGGKGRDTFQLEIADSEDVIVDFDMSQEKEGPTTDQLDVSDLTDRDGNAVKAWDIKVEGIDGGTVLHFPSGERVTLHGLSADAVRAPGMLHAMGVPCFASGTQIMTPSGARRVEEIAVGDFVVTAQGRQVPVLWHGRRDLKAADLLSHPQNRPIRLRAGHYGCQRDLLLSAQHGVRVTGPDGDCLVRAGHLIGKGARLALGLREVCYHHLLLPSHAVIFAEGAPVESFYPGKMAVAALGLADQIDLVRTIQALHPHITTGTVEARYGPRCLSLLLRKEALSLLEKRGRSKVVENRGEPGRATYNAANPLVVT